MHVLKELCYVLEDMVEPIVKKGDISPSELDNVYKSVKTMYYIKTMDAMSNYNSFDERGHSSRVAGGESYRRGRGADGRYMSYDQEHERHEMREGLERLMMNARDDHMRRDIQDMIDKL